MLVLCGRGDSFRDLFHLSFRARDYLAGTGQADLSVTRRPNLLRKEQAVPGLYSEQELRPHQTIISLFPFCNDYLFDHHTEQELQPTVSLTL